VTRYKRYGQMVVVEPPTKIVEEVAIRDLSRETSEVLKRVREGRRAIVTSRGTPVAVIMEIEEAVGLCGTLLVSRREAERRMFGSELDERFRDLESRRLRRMLDR
jgi:prevent-host-death family protein